MADDEWQTVPERSRAPRVRGRGGHRGRGRGRGGGGSGGNWRSRSRGRTPDRSKSRPRVPATAPAGSIPTANKGPGFKLETSNMFEVHVGRNSRARKNAELQEFFETRDDEDVNATGDIRQVKFDDIDDEDLDDMSDYEESDDDGDEATFPPVPISITCKICPQKDDARVFTDAAELTGHLRTEHRISFRHFNHMALLLQAYLDEWAAELAKTPVDKIEGAVYNEDEDVYFVDPAVCETDKEIRTKAQQERLEQVLESQNAERYSVALEPRKCLFCKHVCENRTELFRHGYREHNFNIGLPDNLVNVNEFLQILESKLANLQCLYCEKTFTSPAVLRKHMRKKKHFKISARNRLYDRFYIINYLEPGKNWQAIENDQAGDSDNEVGNNANDQRAGDTSWTDWDDSADLSTRSLFDDHVEPSPELCLKYLIDQYGFDLSGIRKSLDLDFYKTVAFVNYIRKATNDNRCFACDEKFEDNKALVSHIKEKGSDHLVPPPLDSPIWEDRENLLPVIENDPLLMDVDDDDGEFDEEKSRRMLEESKKILRKQFEQVSLDSPNRTPPPGSVC